MRFSGAAVQGGAAAGRELPPSELEKAPTQRSDFKPIESLPSSSVAVTGSAMEDVEVANRAAVASCHRVLALLSQPQDPALLASETGEACAKFRKVVALLGGDGGRSGSHARGRFSRTGGRPTGHFNQTGLSRSAGAGGAWLETMPGSSAAPSPSTIYAGQRARVNGASELRGLDLASSSGKSGARQFGAPKLVQPLSVQFQVGNVAHRYAFPQQQQPSRQAEMFKRSNSGIRLKFESPSASGATGTARSFMSSLSMDESVVSLEGKRPLRLAGAPVAGDPGDVQHAPKRRCVGKGEDGRGKCAATGRCHCSKRSRKLRNKRSIKVPAISNKIADIPPDEYSWRKYGQKPIKGSPHPRGYYKCSSVRGCPARKHVERCVDDPAMLTVTYEGEHNHTRPPPAQPAQT